MGWGSSATTVTGLRAGRSGVHIQAGARNFRVPDNVQTGSGAHPASCSFLGVNRPGREADHSPASSAEVKNEWWHTSTTNIYAFIVCTGATVPFIVCIGATVPFIVCIGATVPFSLIFTCKKSAWQQKRVSFSFLTGAQDSHLQTVTIPEAAYIQLRRRPPEDEQGNARNM